MTGLLIRLQSGLLGQTGQALPGCRLGEDLGGGSGSHADRLGEQMADVVTRLVLCHVPHATLVELDDLPSLAGPLCLLLHAEAVLIGQCGALTAAVCSDVILHLSVQILLAQTLLELPAPLLVHPVDHSGGNLVSERMLRNLDLLGRNDV